MCVCACVFTYIFSPLHSRCRFSTPAKANLVGLDHSMAMAMAMAIGGCGKMTCLHSLNVQIGMCVVWHVWKYINYSIITAMYPFAYARARNVYM